MVCLPTYLYFISVALITILNFLIALHFYYLFHHHPQPWPGKLNKGKDWVPMPHKDVPPRLD